MIYPRSDTLDLLNLYRLNSSRYPCLLDSVSEGGRDARHHILFAFPGESLALYKQDIARVDFLSELDRWYQRESINTSAYLKREGGFCGGWFVFLGYELAAQIEPTLALPLPDTQVIAFATRCKTALIYDRQAHTLSIVFEEGMDRQEIRRRMRLIERDIEHARELASDCTRVPCYATTEQDSKHYYQSVERIQEYIRSGDVFQANLSRAWQVDIDPVVPDADIFQVLRRQNPGPFSALMSVALATGERMSIISSSPERLVSIRDGLIQTRPIAGTHPRVDGAEDARVKQALMHHPKERSEHIMLIDLERNDLGRVCLPGSIQVDELMAVESYRHVHHLVSNIRGRLNPQILPGQVLAAVFPGGTITGCPKVRCMQILAELEQAPRSAYTGSLGYINLNGDMDFNILIRTMERIDDAHRSRLTVCAGGGIVADSKPGQELEETRAKARGMLRVFESAP